MVEDLDQNYHDKYPSISISKIKNIRSWISDETLVDKELSSLHESNTLILEKGKSHITPGPLVHILSVDLKPNNNNNNNHGISVLGSIYAEFHDLDTGNIIRHYLYRRRKDGAEILGTSGGNLTLTGPDYSCVSSNAYIPMSGSLIYAELFDGTHNTALAINCFSLDDSDDDHNNDGYEQVKSFVIPSCDKVRITLHYIAIPFGVFGRINLKLNNKEQRHEVNLTGRITARYENTFGNYDAQECILFEKQAPQFEPVRNYMHISRCWVGVPAYSSLVLDLDLSEYETGQKIINDTVRLTANSARMFSENAFLGNFRMRVTVAWFSPEPLGPRKQDGRFRHEKPCPRPLPSLLPDKPLRSEEVDGMDTDDDDDDGDVDDDGDWMDTDDEYYDFFFIRDDYDDDEEESSDEEPDEPEDKLPSVPRERRDWRLISHKEEVWPSNALEIFSISIFRKQLESEAATLQIYGCIEVFVGCRRTCYLMERDENNPLRLSENANSIPILDPGCRYYEEDTPFKMNFDMKDVNGRLAVKGNIEWTYDLNDYMVERQLCSVIQGPNGFASIHYSVFSRAVQANIMVFVNLKKDQDESSNIHERRKVVVYGSLITEYGMFDYPTCYHKEHYRIALFKRNNEEDAVQLSSGEAMPLSRSLIVVPSYSSLIVNVDISLGVSSVQRVVCAKEIAIGEGPKTILSDDCVMRIVIDWCEIDDCRKS